MAINSVLASPTRHSSRRSPLVYFISIVYMSHPIWGGHCEEAKRGPPSGPRIPRNEGVMMPLFLPYATAGLSLIAGYGLIGTTPRGQARTPAMILPHGCEGLRVRWRAVVCTFRRPFMGRPVPCQLMRNELLDLTAIVSTTAYHRRGYTKRYSRFKPRLVDHGATGATKNDRYRSSYHWQYSKCMRSGCKSANWACCRAQR